MSKRDDSWANDMDKVVAIDIPVGTEIEATWRPKIGSLTDDIASRGVRTFIGTVVGNCKKFIRVRVNCPGGCGYEKAINKVEIFTGEVTITNRRTGKVFSWV